jgi:hypothetical protein
VERKQEKKSHKRKREKKFIKQECKDKSLYRIPQKILHFLIVATSAILKRLLKNSFLFPPSQIYCIFCFQLSQTNHKYYGSQKVIMEKPMNPHARVQTESTQNIRFTRGSSPAGKFKSWFFWRHTLKFTKNNNFSHVSLGENF